MASVFLYPTPTDDFASLSPASSALRIARHTRCASCLPGVCLGFHPPEGIRVILDDDDEYAEALEEMESTDMPNEEGFWTTCACEHNWVEHGSEEGDVRRRLRVAMRLDQLLTNHDKLADFHYTDDSIESLRKQMYLFQADGRSRSPIEGSSKSPPSNHSRKHSSTSVSSLSEPTQESKKRRASSSLSEQGETSEEDKPLASRSGGSTKTRPDGGEHRAGKKATSGLGVASIIPRAGDADPRRDLKVKIEEVKFDVGQIDRLTSGVTVDVSSAIEEGPPPEKPAVVEERKGHIRFVVVRNDGTPQNMIILTGLKNLFQKQLPKMPREYIARLVYDRNSQGMAVVRRGLHVVGGITYRPFPHRKFAEIVFFAIESHFQVSGYGGHLMNHFKTYIRQTFPSVGHFLTYADNYAIGYFKKQGFTKEITFPRQLWVGYIKDYEGGTLMQCALVDKVDYLRTKEILNAQREAILTKIRQMSRSAVVYDGLTQFRNAPEGFEMDYRSVPGLKESGWNPDLEEITRLPTRGPHHKAMTRLLGDLQNHNLAWPFLKPVSKEDVADYHEVIKQPMDFSTMEMKLDNNLYPSFNDFVDDAMLVFSNCKVYNPEGSVYARNATKMEKFVRDWVAAERSKNDSIGY